jgi:hypothetical protein
MSHQVQFRTWGVSLLSLQQIVHLVSLVKWRPISFLFHLHFIWLFFHLFFQESFVSKPEQIRCYFLDEASGMEEKWTVSLATREAVDQLVIFSPLFCPVLLLILLFFLMFWT